MKISGIIFAAFCFLGILANDSFAIADKDGPKIGDVPPPLTLTKIIQGSPATEISWDKLKGKVVVLEFWATWCGPCIRAIPHLNDLVEQFKNKPVIFISVTSENEDVVRLCLNNHPIKAWIGLDDYEVLNKAFHVEGIPHTVIVDAEGRIAAIAIPLILNLKIWKRYWPEKNVHCPCRQFGQLIDLLMTSFPIKLRRSLKFPFVST